jgi:tryptophan synthase alpha chain
MNRIVQRFARLRDERRKGFIVYIGAGDPDLEATHRFALAFERSGVDVLELGIPFSDPLADGLVNQLAAQRGLESGTNPVKVLQTVATIRRESQIPIVLYLYFNLVHRYGVERFIRDAAGAGVDGFLVLDLPPEEGEPYETLMREAGLCNIYLVAPTTPDDRIAMIVKRATGFVYYVSREGVTGMQEKVSGTMGQMVRKIRQYTDLPIAVGFGISTPEQARQVAREADAVVVGSAVVSQIAEIRRSRSQLSDLESFVHSIRQAIGAVEPQAGS